MEQIQEQLRRVGINLKVDVVSHAAYHDQIRKDVCPLVLYSPVRFPVADIPLSQFFHSKSIVGKPTAITNFSHYDKIDDLIERARVEIEPKKQKGYWAQAQRKIIEDAVALPLCSVMVTWARKGNLDYGYELKSSLVYNPLITWTTDKK
jgi:peptide/nickel transport system substrate-binding protein